MKKWWIFVFMYGVVNITLSACQSTPSKSVVVDKSQGFPQENIIEVDNENPKELGTPEYWKETIERSEGFVTLEADYEMKLPEIYNTPVDIYEMKVLSEDSLKNMCDYFADGNSFYEYPKMTKEELRNEKSKMENCEGRWSVYEESYMRLYVKSELEKMDALIENAPEKQTEKNFIEVDFQVPYQTERDFQTNTSDFYYETEEEIGFAARIDEGKEINPYIRVINYDENIGSTTTFLYRHGNYVDERDLEQLKDSTANEGYQIWWEDLQSGLGQKPEISETEAQNIVLKTLQDLEIEDMDIIDCVKVYGSEESESWGLLYEENLETSVGYAFYLSRKAGDITGYHQRSHQIYDELPETVYVPYFKVETLYIVVMEDGIREFEWTNISKKTGTVAENIKLLAFEEIKEKLADHLLYTFVANDGEALKKEGTGYHYKVKNVQLRAANVNAYENPSAVWLVPVWVFNLERTMVNENMGMEEELGEITVVLNAIDGGFVTVRTE